jgi:hypothetical protein
MIADRMRIPSRFNGPPDSGHGGYTCGTVAELLGGAPAWVSLRSPPPLDRDLQVVETGDGVQVVDGERLVGEGARAELDLDPTDAVDPERAAEASRGGFERWADGHPFPTCFACGPRRETGDGLGLIPGPLGDGRHAAPWTPAGELAGKDGDVAPVYVWAALDCPTSAPVLEDRRRPVVLARLHARIDRPVAAGAPHAIVSWLLGVDGRKRNSACAIFDGEGRAVAMSRALWIELQG